MICRHNRLEGCEGLQICFADSYRVGKPVGQTAYFLTHRLDIPLYRLKILGKPKDFPATFERSDENSDGTICTPKLRVLPLIFKTFLQSNMCFGFMSLHDLPPISRLEFRELT